MNLRFIPSRASTNCEDIRHVQDIKISQRWIHGVSKPWTRSPWQSVENVINEGQNINDRSVHNPYGPQDGASWIVWPPGLVAWVTISADLAECQVLKRTKYVQTHLVMSRTMEG
jgi:hypothetical protein